MKRREYTLAVVAGVIVVAAVGERLVLSPLFRAWQGLKDRVTAQESALVAAQQLITRADTIQARYRSSARTVEGDPDTRQIEFLAFLQEAARRAGVTWTTEKPSALVWRRQQASRATPANQGDRYAECTVNLDFTSSLESVVRFLTELAAGQDAVRVRSFTLTAQDAAGRSLKVTLRLSTVILAPAPGARRPASPQAGGSLSPMALALGEGGSGGEAEATSPRGLGEPGGWSEGAERMEARP